MTLQSIIKYILYCNIAAILHRNISEGGHFIVTACYSNIAATFRNVVAMLQFCKKILLQYCCNLSVLYGILLNFVLPLICIKLCNKYVKVYLISTIDMASYFVDKFCYISVSILSIRLYMSDLLSNL